MGSPRGPQTADDLIPALPIAHCASRLRAWRNPLRRDLLPRSTVIWWRRFELYRGERRLPDNPFRPRTPFLENLDENAVAPHRDCCCAVGCVRHGGGWLQPRAE